MNTIVTLAQTWNNQDPTNWYMSEKLDGVRAVWNGTCFVSRNNKPINAPEWFKQSMPQNCVLDGELYAGRGKFQECVGIVKHKIPESHEWQKIRYMAFDVIDHTKTWIERFRVNPTSVCIPVEHYFCTTLEYMMLFYNSVVEHGGEGIMLRNPEMKYELRRSPNLLKVKPELTLEAKVITIIPGEGKYTGMVGALECADFEHQKLFCVGSGFTDEQRLRSNAPKVGSNILVKYQCLTDEGRPRFPVFVKQLT